MLALAKLFLALVEELLIAVAVVAAAAAVVRQILFAVVWLQILQIRLWYLHQMCLWPLLQIHRNLLLYW